VFEREGAGRCRGRPQSSPQDRWTAPTASEGVASECVKSSQCSDE
jgi:hypothetical protein